MRRARDRALVLEPLAESRVVVIWELGKRDALERTGHLQVAVGAHANSPRSPASKRRTVARAVETRELTVPGGTPMISPAVW